MCLFKSEDIQGPIGMFHCPECGEMVVAGVPHPDYSILDNLEDEELDLMKEDEGFFTFDLETK